MKKRPEALQRLMNEGFGERIGRFRVQGRALELREVPAVLDELLNLRSTELRLLLGEMGLDYRGLLRQGKLPHGPTTAEQLIRALSGELTGKGEPLPTTSREARDRAHELLIELTGLRGKPGADGGAKMASLQRLATEHIEVAKKIDGLKRMPWHQRIGGYAQVGFHMRFFQAPTYKKDGSLNGAANQGGWIKLSREHGPTPKMKQQMGYKPGKDALIDLSGSSFSPAKAELASKLTSAQLTTTFGAQVSEVDRRTGKRKVSPYFSEIFKTTFFAVGYMASRERRGRSVKAGFQLVQLAYDPVFGTNLRITLPWIGGLFVSERYLGVGLFNRGALKDGLTMPGVPFIKIPVSVAVGAGGDMVEHVTGPLLRWLEDQVDRVQRLGVRLRRKKHATADDPAPVAKPAPRAKSLGFDVRELEEPVPGLPLVLHRQRAAAPAAGFGGPATARA